MDNSANDYNCVIHENKHIVYEYHSVYTLCTDPRNGARYGIPWPDRHGNGASEGEQEPIQSCVLQRQLQENTGRES